MHSTNDSGRKSSRNRGRNEVKRVIDPVAAEREDYDHWVLERLIFDLCRQQGVTCLTNRHVDLLARFGMTSILFEVKSGSSRKLELETRLAVAQLLEYRYLYRKIVGSDVRLCVVVRQRPRPQYGWLIGYLADLKMGLIWKNDKNDCLNCSDFTRELIGDLLPSIKELDFGPSRPANH